MATIKVDSKEYEVDSAVKSHMTALEAKVEAANAKAEKVDNLEGERDGLKAKVTQLEEELEEAKENTVSEEEIDKAVEERAELVDSAKTFLGDSYDFKGKTSREIKEEVVKTSIDSFDATDKSDDYVNGFFESLAKTADTKGFTRDANFGRSKPSDENEEELEKKKAARRNIGKKGDK